MMGRLNAAFNQTANMDKSIEDVMEHFVYLPKQATVNAQDIPFFLSTRLEMASAEETVSSAPKDGDPSKSNEEEFSVKGDPVTVLSNYENRAAQLAHEYEENMVRF